MKRTFLLLIIMSLFVFALCTTAFGTEANVFDNNMQTQPNAQVNKISEYELFKQMQANTDEE